MIAGHASRVAGRFGVPGGNWTQKHPEHAIVRTGECTMARGRAYSVSEQEAQMALADEVIEAEACQFLPTGSSAGDSGKTRVPACKRVAVSPAGAVRRLS
ncbi:DUF6233 domain-containing protein [Streptomyces chiangmaiensis]|uniref:DUF6233 domain-containing protein n=1 Tax=Streptomyces chiangmaiensis TaxID=766497 RepID=UPI00338A2C42